MPADNQDESVNAPKNAAVRSYLSATITPVLLKALVALEKEDATPTPPDRPVLWLAQYLEEYAANN